MNREAAIGIFDSGVGGLTVVHALLEALPAEHLVYLGDTGRYPYGTKSAETVTRYICVECEEDYVTPQSVCSTCECWNTVVERQVERKVRRWSKKGVELSMPEPESSTVTRTVPAAVPGTACTRTLPAAR